MNAPALVSPLLATPNAAAMRVAEEQKRTRRIKIWSSLAVCVATWYSVPYSLPLQLDADPAIAAANEAQAFQGSLSRQIAVPVLFALSLYVLFRLRKRVSFDVHSRVLQLGIAYGAWVLLSAVWSDGAATSLKRAAVFLMDGAFLCAIAQVASTIEMAVLGFCSTGVVAALALYADVVLLRSFAPFDPEYRFMGVMTANYQAMNLFVGLVCGLTLLQWRPAWFRWLVGPLLLEMALLFLTRARIGTFLFVAVLLFVIVRMARVVLQPHARALLIVSAATLLAPALLYATGKSGGNALSSVFMMGRNDTENTASLSNRAPLWAELWESVEERPIAGYGFEAFWTPVRVSRISLDQGWVVPHAHNTYLDQLLSLGVIGALLYAATLFSAAGLAWKRYMCRPDAIRFLPAILLSWVALLGLTESLPLAPHLPTLLAYACVAKMCCEPEGDDTPEAESGGDQQRERPSAFPPILPHALELR